MSATIEVVLVDGGGTAEDTQAANQAGRMAQETGAFQIPQNVNRTPEASRSAMEAPSPASEPPQGVTTRQSGREGLSTDAANVALSPSVPRSDAVTRTPAGSRPTDDAILEVLKRQADRPKAPAESSNLPATARESVKADDTAPTAERNASQPRDVAKESKDDRRTLRDESAPTRDDYKGLTDAMKGLAEKLDPRNLVDLLRGKVGEKTGRTERTEHVSRETTRERIDRSATSTDRQRTDNARTDQSRERSESMRERITREVVERVGQTRLGQAIRRTAARDTTQASNVARRVSESRIGQAVGRAGTQVAGRLQSSRAFRAGVDALGNTRAGQAITRRLAPVARPAASVVARAGTAIATRTAATAAVGSAATAGTAGAAGAGAAGAAGTAAAGGTIAAVGAVALPVVAVVAALGGLVLAARKLTGAFAKQADQLEDVSPNVAGARAQNEWMMERARIDRAQAIGRSTGNLESARGRLAESSYRLQTQFLSILSTLEPALTRGMDGITLLVDLGRLLASKPLKVIADATPNKEDDKFAARVEADATRAVMNGLRRMIHGGGDNAERDPMLDDLRELEAEFGQNHQGIQPNGEL